MIRLITDIIRSVFWEGADHIFKQENDPNALFPFFFSLFEIYGRWGGL